MSDERDNFYWRLHRLHQEAVQRGNFPCPEQAAWCLIADRLRQAISELTSDMG
jgi:hypothetical protein